MTCSSEAAVCTMMPTRHSTIPESTATTSADLLQTAMASPQPLYVMMTQHCLLQIWKKNLLRRMSAIYVEKHTQDQAP